MRLTIGFSPCPNDTYIFYALINQLIDTKGIVFEPYIADVEELNLRAFETKLDITKISFHAYLSLTETYALLDTGSALGNHCGPILIRKANMQTVDLSDKRIAIPGEHTTAHFLLDYYLSVPVRKQIMLFSEIESAVESGTVDAGVIIHENRFTFEDRGLVAIEDLGAHWEACTKHPIPLGGIVAQRKHTDELLTIVQNLIGESIQYAQQHPAEVINYVKEYAQEMSEEIIWQHINLYVNDYSRSLGERGRSAIVHFFEQGVAAGKIDRFRRPFL